MALAAFPVLIMYQEKRIHQYLKSGKSSKLGENVQLIPGNWSHEGKARLDKAQLILAVGSGRKNPDQFLKPGRVWAKHSTLKWFLFHWLTVCSLLSFALRQKHLPSFRTSGDQFVFIAPYGNEVQWGWNWFVDQAVSSVSCQLPAFPRSCGPAAPRISWTWSYLSHPTAPNFLSGTFSLPLHALLYLAD